jgi:hypothetical protein
MKSNISILNGFLITAIFTSLTVFADTPKESDCDCGKRKPKENLDAAIFNRSSKKKAKKKQKKEVQRNKKKALSKASLPNLNAADALIGENYQEDNPIANEGVLAPELEASSQLGANSDEVTITYGIYDKEERELMQKSLEETSTDSEFYSSCAPTEVEAIANESPYRLLSSKDPQGWNVELDDGSIWRAIGSSDADAIKKWRSNDPIVIHPTLFPSISGGRFFLYNQRLNSYAISEISAGPILNSAMNARISYIDIYSGLIELRDGKGRACYYRLDYSEKTLFKDWRIGDSIIIGSNEDCYSGWFSRAPFILINIECNNFIKASLE